MPHSALKNDSGKWRFLMLLLKQFVAEKVQQQVLKGATNCTYGQYYGLLAFPKPATHFCLTNLIKCNTKAENQ